MAVGQGQGGALFSRPDNPGLGPATWAEMSGVHPDSPLVGGRGAFTGGIDADYRYRRVALAGASHQPMAAAPAQQHARELLNFGGSPMPWILIAAIAYLGLVHLHVSGAVSARAGK